jgi:cell division protein FtsN
MIRTGTAPVIVERALNSVLGPVLGAVTSTPVITAVTTSSNLAVPAEPQTEVLVKQKPVETPPVQEPQPALEIVNVLPDSPEATDFNTAPAQVQVQTFYNAPAAKILGAVPPAGSSKSYRLQIGAFTVPRNALNAFDKLKNAGLNPAYEQNGEFYRVVLAGLKADEIQAVAQVLGNTGYQEAIIREEAN